MPTFDLGLEHVSLDFATKTIFTDVTQGVFEGDRIGIVGRNGDGKSTLLHLLEGTQAPDSGRVTTRNGLTFGMLDQRDQLDDDASKAARITNGPRRRSPARSSRRCSAASISMRGSARSPAASVAAPTSPACCSRTGMCSHSTSRQTTWTS